MLSIDDLPDDVLLNIFDFRTVNDLDFSVLSIEESYMKREIESWQSLVHVCRRWRGLVFRSPRRLKLQLFCTHGKSARKSLDVWPALPLLIHCGHLETETSADNAIAELEHSDRIRQILFYAKTSHIESLCTAMQAPFPELEILSLSFQDVPYVPVLPNSFLGGSVPRLRSLNLYGVPFPGLPKVLLSATHIVNFWLENIPHSGYMSPEAIVTCLSMLTSLENFRLDFESPQSCPDQEIRSSQPPSRSILPSLSFFCFKGVNEYLEDLVSRFDAPQLTSLSIYLFNDIHFDATELNQFISRTLTLGTYDQALLTFHSRQAEVELTSHHHYGTVNVSILCQVPDWQLSSLAQIFNLSLHLLLTMENLYIQDGLYPPSDWKDDIENTEWFDLLLPFTAVKNLYLSKKFAPRIAPALQELTGGRTTEVLPALQNILLEGFEPSEPVQEGIARFISARQLTNHTIAVSLWDRYVPGQARQ